MNLPEATTKKCNPCIPDDGNDCELCLFPSFMSKLTKQELVEELVKREGVEHTETFSNDTYLIERWREGIVFIIRGRGAARMLVIKE